MTKDQLAIIERGICVYNGYKCEVIDAARDALIVRDIDECCVCVLWGDVSTVEAAEHAAEAAYDNDDGPYDPSRAGGLYEPLCDEA